jgi:hypothetical protein
MPAMSDEQVNAKREPMQHLSPQEVIEPYFRHLGRIAKSDLPLLLTLGYLLLTITGMAYEWWLFRAFDINIMEYADIGDFLLAALREPLVVTLCLASVGSIFLYYRFDQWLRHRCSGWYSRYEKYFYPAFIQWSPRTQRVLFGLLCIGYFVAVFAPLYARVGVYAVKKASFTAPVQVRVNNNGPEEEAVPDRAYLIGTTTRFLFLYDRAQRQTYIVPLENVSYITVASRRAPSPPPSP